MSEAFYTMKIVTEKTGLNQHVIRVWEKRYGAIKPQRTGTNRRVYDEADITKLEFLKLLTDNGYPISQIANKDVDELSELIVKDKLSLHHKSNYAIDTIVHEPKDVIQKCIEYLSKFETNELESILLDESVKHSQFDFITKIIEPLLIEVGNKWSSGELRVSHEHLVSSMIKMILMNFKNANLVLNNTNTVLFTTPSGQLHELGALMGSVIASSFGLNAIYLGPNLPVEEIIFAIHENNAKAVVLSIIYPLNDLTLNAQLERLKKLLKTDTDIIVSCKDAKLYMPVIKNINAKLIKNFNDFNRYIQSIS